MGARATYVELAANYNTKSQNAVFLSARTAAKALGVSKNTAGKWLHELEHYGFIVLIQGHHLGLNGAGKASRYRLTDRYYAGKEPTYDFQNWDGVLFDSEKNPVPKIETPCTKNWDIREGAVGMQMGTTAPIFGT